MPRHLRNTTIYTFLGESHHKFTPWIKFNFFSFLPFFRKGIAASLCITTFFPGILYIIYTHFFKSFFKKTSQKNPPFVTPISPNETHHVCFELQTSSRISKESMSFGRSAWRKLLAGLQLFPPNPRGRRRPSRVVTCGSARWVGQAFRNGNGGWLGNSPSCGLKEGILLMHPNRCNHEKQRAVCDVHFFRTIFSPLTNQPSSCLEKGCGFLCFPGA